ncbi:CehA/McbA family metallohydrolase [Candidatus Hydrogenedentota bacterium]
MHAKTVVLCAIASACFASCSHAERKPSGKHAESATMKNGSGTLVLTIIDKSDGTQVPARVLLRDGEGKSHIPKGSTRSAILNDKWFLSDGGEELDVPAGELTIRVERGKEYRGVNEEVTIKPGAKAEHVVTLERWIDMKKRGYLKGENHLHLKVEWMPAMFAAEDLDFGHTLLWWNGQKLPVPGEEGAIQDQTFGGVTVPGSIFDAEVENAWGAVYLLGLPEQMPLPADKKRPMLDYVKWAREKGALISYQGGWSAEVLVDALLGYVDVVNVCNNMFHRHRYLGRTGYMNILDAKGLPMYEPTAEGMMQLNLESYYRLLNCGLKLAVGAGSATGVKGNPAGYNRAYVRAPESATLLEFLDEWRKGRNFVTNGPMIFLAVDGKYRPGDEIDFGEQGKSVNVKVTALSDQPLSSLEIIVNGEVKGSARIGENCPSAELDLDIKIEEGSWIAARATDDDQTLTEEEIQSYIRSVKGKASPENARKGLTSLRYGHTSPVYVRIGGKGARVQQSVNEARNMLNAFEPFARKNAREKYLAGILEALEEARTKLDE